MPKPSLPFFAAHPSAKSRDLITALYDRSAFYFAVQEELQRHPETFYTLVHFDLGHFKNYNAIYGMQRGDALLKEMAHHYLIFSGGEVPCARFEADHFVVLKPQSELLIREYAEVVEKWLSRYQPEFPFVTHLGTYTIRDRSMDVRIMCEKACWAARIHKNDACSTIHDYHTLVQDQALSEQIYMVQMNRGLKEGQFLPYLQPQYDIVTGALTGAEVLVRWQHPERGLLLPQSFLPTFEQNGAIDHLDRYMWKCGCQILARWRQRNIKPIPLSVNVSRYSLFTPDFQIYLNALLQTYQIPRHLFRLEITESVYVENKTRMAEILQRLRADGYLVEMDDFGRGYSSLAALKDFDIIKLDFGFLTGAESQRCQIILRNVVHMARELGLEVVAEGVETEEEDAFLKKIGCHLAQGYYYARPVSLERMEALMEAASENFPQQY